MCFVFCRADFDKYSEDPEFKPASRHTKELFEEVSLGGYVLLEAQWNHF